MGRGRVKIRSKLSSWRPSRFKLTWEVAGSKLSSWRPSRFKLTWKGAGPNSGQNIVLETVAKWQKFASKRLPARIWPKTGRFPMIPDEKFNSRPRGRQMAESCFQKAPGQDLAKNGQWHWRPSCFKLKWEGAGSKLGSKLSSWRPSRFKLKWEVAGSKLGSNYRPGDRPVSNWNERAQGQNSGQNYRPGDRRQWQKCASKRLPARIWPKRPFPNDPRREIQ